MSSDEKPHKRSLCDDQTIHPPTSPHIKKRKQAGKQHHMKKTMTLRTNESLYQLVKPEYIIDGHLRKVLPYYFEYQIYAKQRWWGRELGEVFCDEFQDRPVEYYAAALAQGFITVNGQACTLNYKICNGDLISHRLHRHEPPVSSQHIDILSNDGRLLVVNKPSSMPVHPSGRYRFNTLVEVLKHDLHLTEPIGIVNRLDRLTSGVCMLSVGGGRVVHEDMAGGRFSKEYVARVKGHFPPGRIECSEPLRLLDHKLGVVVVDAVRGKEAVTAFELICHLGGQGVGGEQEESLVRCWPTTGRTHQIRVHLLSLGHPISNDPLYSHSCWQELNSCSDNVLQILMKAQREGEEGLHCSDNGQTLFTSSAPTTPVETSTSVALSLAQSQSQSQVSKPLSERSSTSDEKATGVDLQVKLPPLCLDCARTTPLPDPCPEQLCLYLHAHKYSCAEWSHVAPLPLWAGRE